MMFFENTMSSSVLCSNALGETIDSRLKIDVIISMMRVTDVMAEKRKTILVKRRSAFLASIWLPVRLPCFSITCLIFKIEKLFIRESIKIKNEF